MKIYSCLLAKVTKRSIRQIDQAGFTLIELLMAMALFAFMMLIIASGFLNVTKIYRSTLAARKTQASARITIEEIARHIRVSNDAELSGSNVLCLYGTARVRFRVVDDGTNSQLVRESFSDLDGCANLAAYANRQILTATDLRVPSGGGFVVSVLDSTSTTPSVQITLKVATNTPDLLGGGNDCIPGVSGADFCSTTLFTTAVALRGETSP